MKTVAACAAILVLLVREAIRERRAQQQAPIYRPRSVWIVTEDEWETVKDREVIWTTTRWDPALKGPVPSIPVRPHPRARWAA